MKLRLSQVLNILLMFDIEAIINSRGILTDEIDFGKILILLLFSHLLIYCRLSNVLVNLCIITGF